MPEPPKPPNSSPEEPNPPLEKVPLSDAEREALERRRIKREKEYADWLKEQTGKDS